MFVDVPLVPPEKIPRALLTSPGDPMPVGLTIEMFQLMTSWVKANGASRECSSLAMRCVILAWSETWTQNLMIEKCGQKPMKTPNAITRCSTAQFSTNNPVPNRPQPIPRLGTQLTWKVNCGSKELKLKLVSPRAELAASRTKPGSLTGTVLSQVLEMLVEAPKKWFEQTSSIIKTNNNNQQHKKDTIPCAQAMLSVCDCMKYLVYHGSRSLGKASYGFTKASTN